MNEGQAPLPICLTAWSLAALAPLFLVGALRITGSRREPLSAIASLAEVSRPVRA